MHYILHNYAIMLVILVYLPNPGENWDRCIVCDNDRMLNTFARKLHFPIEILLQVTVYHINHVSSIEYYELISNTSVWW